MLPSKLETRFPNTPQKLLFFFFNPTLHETGLGCGILFKFYNDPVMIWNVKEKRVLDLWQPSKHFVMSSSPKNPAALKEVTHKAILYADRRDRRKSPGVPGAAIAIFVDRGDRRIWYVRYRRLNSPVPAILTLVAANRQMRQPIRLDDFYHTTLQNGGHQRCLEPGNKIGVANRRDRCRKSPSVPTSINGEIIRSRSKSPRSAYKIA